MTRETHSPAVEMETLAQHCQQLRLTRVGLSLSHSERAPSIDELFSFGPHGGSQQFLIGDIALNKESSNGAELSATSQQRSRCGESDSGVSSMHGEGCAVNRGRGIGVHGRHLNRHRR